MASVCISNCINDTHTPIIRPTYINLYKWPESDAEFVKSVSQPGGRPHPRVVDSFSCRQLYLRSYTFSREETVPQKTPTCLGKLVRQKRESVLSERRNKVAEAEIVKDKRKCVMVKKTVLSIFHRFLSCTTTVDVAA